VAGCIDRSQSGGTTVYTFASWVVCIPAVPGVALLAIGAFLVFGTKSYRWGGLGLITLGVACLAFFMPMLSISRVEVDDEHFVSVHGLPWAMSRDEEKFDELATIEVEETIETKNGVESGRSYALLCRRKSGQTNTVPIGDLMKGASSDILTRAKKKEVLMQGMEALPGELRPR
jgi:hypothetical protein